MTNKAQQKEQESVRKWFTVFNLDQSSSKSIENLNKLVSFYL
jgi:hypothetical protein